MVHAIQGSQMKLKNTFFQMRGLAIVEMAIVAPVFLIMLFGILEFGIVLYDKAIITNASLQLAQSGSQMTSTSMTLPPSSSEISNVIAAVTSPSAVTNVVGNSLLSFGTTVQPGVTATIDGWKQLGYPLSVTVKYNFKSLVLAPLMTALKIPGRWDSNNSIELSSTTTMYLN